MSDLADGFTLMELLIVISIILILMLMAVPTIGSMMKRANETSAVNSLRTIVTAEFMYANTYPKKGFAGVLQSSLAFFRLTQLGDDGEIFERCYVALNFAVRGQLAEQAAHDFS